MRRRKAPLLRLQLASVLLLVLAVSSFTGWRSSRAPEIENGSIPPPLVEAFTADYSAASLPRNGSLEASITAPLSADVSGTETWALIIGVGDYQNFEPPPSTPLPSQTYDIPWAADAARGVYETVRPIWGEDHVKLLVDAEASKADIQSALVEWLAPKEGPEDTVFLFFAGHGNSEYLCTWNASLTSYANWISGFLLDSWLDVFDSQQVAVVLDSCRSGAYANSLKVPGRLILAASDVNESAWFFGALNSGVFTYYLHESLEQLSLADANADCTISAEEMFRYAEPKVISYTTDHSDVQHPQVFDGIAGELGLFKLAKVTLGVSLQDIPLTVDGTELNAAQLPVSVSWLSGTRHIIRVRTLLQDEEEMRYSFVSWNDGNTASFRTVTASQSTTLTANYTRQYHLTVSTEHGTPQGQGWYDEGDEAEISVDEGTAWYRSFAGWKGDLEKKSRQTRILMDSPKTEIASWRPSMNFWLAVAGAMLFLAALSALTVAGIRYAILTRRTRQRVLASAVPETPEVVTVNSSIDSPHQEPFDRNTAPRSGVDDPSDGMSADDQSRPED